VAFRGLRKRHSDLSKVMRNSVLVTDGRTVYLLDRQGALEDLRFGQLAFAFVIELGGIRDELAVRAKRFAIPIDAGNEVATSSFA
jgi:hypothetical protein